MAAVAWIALGAGGVASLLGISQAAGAEGRERMENPEFEQESDYLPQLRSSETFGGSRPERRCG